MGRSSAPRVLCACEESQAVTECLRRMGIEAYSCDLLPTSGRHPEWHIQADALQVAKLAWDAVLAFPPCTNLAVSGARWFDEKRRDGRQQMGIGFFLAFTALDWVPHVAIENPIGIMSSLYRKPDQIVQPWMFGEPETKATCLWLKGLPKLRYTDDVHEAMEALPDAEKHRIHSMPPSPQRGMLRSKTYPGIADAMAAQWGGVPHRERKGGVAMNGSKLYTIELGGDLGDIATMHRLVRCKECRHVYEHHDARGRQLLCDLHTNFHVGPEGFCAWGEEREDGR